ncbi:MAG: hypothetical protein EXQ56_02800 [Acidobacteria bacterium]|nr:hypothetical protein [Acidobacteriota bacterium]
MLLAIAAALVGAAAVNQLSAEKGDGPQGGYPVWHQTNDNNGPCIIVDKVGLFTHLLDHELDHEFCEE